jgi:hypothetical protein
MELVKICGCGQIHKLLELKNTKEFGDLKLISWNCECNSTLAIKESALIDILLDNAWATKCRPLAPSAKGLE